MKVPKLPVLSSATKWYKTPATTLDPMIARISRKPTISPTVRKETRRLGAAVAKNSRADAISGTVGEANSVIDCYCHVLVIQATPPSFSLNRTKFLEPQLVNFQFMYSTVFDWLICVIHSRRKTMEFKVTGSR